MTTIVLGASPTASPPGPPVQDQPDDLVEQTALRGRGIVVPVVEYCDQPVGIGGVGLHGLLGRVAVIPMSRAAAGSRSGRPEREPVPHRSPSGSFCSSNDAQESIEQVPAPFFYAPSSGLGDRRRRGSPRPLAKRRCRSRVCCRRHRGSPRYECRAGRIAPRNPSSRPTPLVCTLACYGNVEDRPRSCVASVNDRDQWLARPATARRHAG